jgi:hypothetical protein
MSSIKITPIILFLLLLVVLVISVLFGNYLLSKEGFVSFQEDKSPLELVLIPTYSSTNTVAKLYDNLYFDNKNGNLIEVDSTQYSGNVDTTGITIATTNVVPRINSTTSFTFTNKLTNGSAKPQDTTPSLIREITPSYNSYMYPTQSKNTDTYVVFCFPWNTATYIHVLNKTTKLHVASYHSNPTIGIHNYSYSANSSTNTPVYINGFNPTPDPINSTNANKITNPLYDGKSLLYQLSSYASFDITNGNLILQTTPKGSSASIDIYNRNGTKQTSTAAGTIQNNTSTVLDIGFKPFVINDLVGNTEILYFPYQKNTLIAIISYSDATMSSYTINNVVRFTPTTVDTGNTKTPNMNVLQNVNTNLPIAPPTQDSAMSEYFKWYWYWKNNGQPANLNYSDDYLLKTQIVPPVCPSCPLCSGGACTNCGGQGGSGTLSQNGNTVVGGSTISNVKGNANVMSPTTTSGNYSVIGNGTFASNADPNTVGGSLTLASYDTVAGAEGIAQTGAGVIGNVAGTIGNVANTAIGTVGNVAHDVTGLIGGAGSGAAKLLTQNSQRQNNQPPLINTSQNNQLPLINTSQNNQSKLNSQLYGKDNTTTTQGPNGKPMTINRTEGAFQSPYGTSSTDQYSYYGSLPNKGSSNYMPLTADFSAFGK